MKKLITFLLFLLIGSVYADPNPCNIQPKKRMSYKTYCKINNIKEKKAKQLKVKIISFNANNMNTALFPTFK